VLTVDRDWLAATTVLNAERVVGEGGMNGHKLNVDLPVSLQPAVLIHEYRL